MATRSTTSRVTRPTTSAVTGNGVSGGSGGGPTFTWFVDSENGSDSNTGTSANAAFATAAKAVSVLSNDESIGFARGGSYDKLDLSSFTGITIDATGSGDLPLFRSDAQADPADWSLSAHGDAAGVVYEISWNHNIDADISRIGLWVDGVRPLRVASVALCASTPGTFYSPSDASLTSNDPCTIYYHPTGSTNPTSDGKVVEITIQSEGIKHGADCTIKNVHGFRNAHDNGPIWTDTTGSVWEQILCEDGTKHNCLLPDTATDVICAAVDQPTAGTAMFTAYKNDPSADTGTYVRLGCHGLRSGANPAVDAFYAHGSPNDWLAISHDQGWSRKVGDGNTGWSILRAVTASVTNFFSDNCGRALAMQTDNGTLRRISILNTTGVAINFQKLGASATHSIRDVAAYMTNPSNVAEIQIAESGHTATITECTLFSAGAGATRQIFCSNFTSTVNISKCIFVGPANFYPFFIDGATTYSSDFNVFLATSGSFRFRRTDISGFVSTLANHQSINGEDLNSVYALIADQTAGSANALWLGYAEASIGTSLSTIGPAAGDFRINPDARVYKGDGTAMIGTFADETTPITEAGQQTHWNPTARAVVSTPQTSWVTLPDSIDEIKTYLANPAAWSY